MNLLTITCHPGLARTAWTITSPFLSRWPGPLARRFPGSVTVLLHPDAVPPGDGFDLALQVLEHGKTPRCRRALLKLQANEIAIRDSLRGPS